MKVAAVSEIKAKLAKYLRLVKSGEEIEIQERGVPIAILSSANCKAPLESIPPRKDPKKLAKLKFSTKLAPEIDVVHFLMEDRKRR